MTFKIEHREPIEIGDFVSSFTSIASQYQRYLAAQYPELNGDAQIYVKQVQAGSIIIDLIPLIQGSLGPMVTMMDQVVIVSDFVRFVDGRLGQYYTKGGRTADASRSDLRDFMNGVAAIANDPDGKATLSAVAYEDGEKKIKAALSFTTPQARIAQVEIERHRLEIEQRTDADYLRVLMVFSQANTKGTPPGKRSGERVTIEAISDRDLPLIYASELTEQRIKHEIAEADENVFKKGFVVDVNVQLHGGRPVAYRVMR